ncbi:hypothetical protein [Flaviramulus aquimarinus]
MKKTQYFQKSVKFLLISFLLLLVANLLSIFLITKYGYSYDKSIIRIFNFDTEQSFPTLFSALLLGVSSFLFFYIALNKKNKKYWLILSFVFLFLVIDEAIGIHELLVYTSRNLLNAKGFLYFTWVVPYSIISLIVVLVLFKFLMSLPKKTLYLFILSAVISVGGAIGMEMIAGNIVYALGDKYFYNVTYMVCYTLEESMEMLGLILLIYSLLDYIITQKLKPLKIEFK